MPRKNRFLSCVMVIASTAVLIQPSLESATETHRGIEEIVNEYLFTAGYDSTGTAAITYASHLHPHPPVIHRFENFSFPDSCASHPSRCRFLTYRQPNNLIFYVPLTEHLGVMEFSDNGTTLSHVQTRIVEVGERCDPISIMDIRGTLYLICVSDRDQLMSCEVRNTDIVKNVQLVCTTPSVRVNTSLLSNFVVYGNRNPDLYFTYGNAMYRRVITSNYNEFLATLLPDYSHCRHLELVQHPEPMIAAYCYLHSSNDNIQVVYFHLNEHHFQEQINATTFVKYDCPSLGTFVEVTSHGAYASYWENNSYIGSFNIIGNSVTFGTCFKFQNATHFVYRDRQLGTFIKPNISVDLRSGVDQLSAGPCQSPACEQPVIFENQYVLALHQNVHDWTQKLFDIQRGTGSSILEFNVRDAAQLALISDLVTYPEPTTPTPVTTASPKVNGDKLVTITSTTVSVGGLLIFIVIASLLVLVFYLRKNHKTCLHRDKGQRQNRGTYYTSVGDERNSRQGSPDSPGDTELDPLTEGEEQQPTAMTNPRAIRTNEHEADDISRQSSGSDINHSPRTPLDREDFTALGRDDVATSLQSTPLQLTQQMSTATVTATNVEQQHGTEQSPELQTHLTTSSPPNMGKDPVPLQSQRSHDSTRSASSNHGDATLAPPHTLPQALRPVSLVTGPLSNGQATTSTPPLSPNRAPVRYNSNESSASDGTSNSGCRSTDLRTNPNSGSMSLSPTAAVPSSSSIQSIARNDRELATVELPLNREGYQGVGASQEDVQQPNQCTQPHGQRYGTGAGNANTPHALSGHTGLPPPPSYSRQHSYDSSTGSLVPDNDSSALRPRMRQRPRSRHSSLSSPLIELHAHSPNQPPGHTVSSPTSNRMPNVFTHRSLSSESDTSQTSNTPSVNQGHPSFFSSDLNSDNTILPPHSENLSSAHLATGTHCSSRMVPPNFHRLNSNDSGHT